MKLADAFGAMGEQQEDFKSDRVRECFQGFSHLLAAGAAVCRSF